MSDQTGIEWTDATWNPVTGCTKVSPGCKNCYAERLALRLRAMGNPRYRNGFAVTLHPDQITLPLRWRQPRRIFVNSMSDLFHEAVPDDFIYKVFEVMAQADWHVFQVLTKGPVINKVSNFSLGVDIMTTHEAGRSAAAEVRLGLADVGRADAPPDGGE